MLPLIAWSIESLPCIWRELTPCYALSFEANQYSPPSGLLKLTYSKVLLS